MLDPCRGAARLPIPLAAGALIAFSSSAQTSAAVQRADRYAVDQTSSKSSRRTTR
jgi:hypothetical protein